VRGVEGRPGQPVFQQFDAGLPQAAGGNGEGSAFSRFLPLLHKSVNCYPYQDRQTRIDGMGIDIDHVWKEARDLPEAAATALTLKWAYYAYTFREQGSYYQGKAIREYNVFQAENNGQGNVVRGIEIHEGEEKKTFLWMLDQVDIPHNLGEGDICIPFLPMEREMQKTVRRKARSWFSKDR